MRSSPDLQGVLDGIGNIGGDIWGVITKVLPKNADGSVDWGKVGGDIVGFVKNHATDILAAASIANQAYRGAKADEYAGKAVKTAEDIYAAKKPLRDAGMAGMLKGGDAYKPDHSALNAMATTGSGNPFAGAKAAALPMGPTQGPATPQQPQRPTTVPQMPGGSPGGPQPFPIMPPVQSGPIANGPQDRTGMPAVPPLPMGPTAPPMPNVQKPRLALPMAPPVDPNNPDGTVPPMLRAM
jgi:hypothetical protein